MLFASGFGSRRARRNLASAFVGEVAAVLRAIERNPLLHEGGEALVDEEAAEDCVAELPHVVVYEANAGHLDLFNAPLPRELTYFYTRVSALAERLHALAAPHELSEEIRGEYVHLAQADAHRAMELGDELLRHLRPLVSHHQPDTISRA
jgi:hypothetical protein